MLAKQLLKIIFAGAAIATAWGQVTPGPILPFPPYDPYTEVKKFLNLTADQSSTLNSIQAQYQLLFNNKMVRVNQVNQEIDQETVKPSLDATALGVRYLELEVICREMKSAAAGISTSSLAVLTDAQKTKLKQLEDAQKLAPTISQAQSLGLLPGGAPGFTGWFDTTGFTVSYYPYAPNFPACRSVVSPVVSLNPNPIPQTVPGNQR